MKKIIIIGGGIAGLSAGIYALKAGFEAEIYEKNAVAGGECMGWNRGGCHIDNCIHWLTGTSSTSSMHKVWRDVGALDDNTQYADVDMFYSCRVGGRECTLHNDLDRTERELIAISPDDEAEIRKLIQHLRYTEDCQLPAEKPMDMMSIKDYIALGKSMRNMPKVMKEYGKISIAELAARFRSPLIRTLLTDYMPAEYTAFSFLISYATMTSGNGKIPAGGSLAMAMRMLEKFKENGGKINLNAPVKKILIENKKAVGIELENNEKITADFIISAVDTNLLFTRLLDERLIPAKLTLPYRSSEKHPTMSGFQIAYEADEACAPKGTILFGCEPFKMNKKEISRLSLKSYSYEKSFAPEGKTVLQTNVAQYDDDFLYWKSLSPEDYRSVKAELSEAVAERITTQFPELKGSLKMLDCWTPLTYERYCGAYHGSYMGFIIRPGVKQSKINGVIKGIGGLYIAGQWIMSPGGLPIAAVSGKFAVQRILKKLGRSVEI